MKSFYLFVFAVLIFTLSVFGIHDVHAASFTATQSGNWDDPATWGGSSLPAIITTSDTIVVPAGIEVLIPSAYTVNNSGTINNFGIIKNFGEVNGYVHIFNSGTIENSGMIQTSGLIINNPSGIVINVATGVINKVGSSTFYNQGVFENYGSVHVTGGYSSSSSELLTYDNGIFKNFGTTTIQESGVETYPDGTIQNFGTINVTLGSELLNQGIFENSLNGTIYVDAALFETYNQLTNYGLIDSQANGELDFSETVDNHGTINVSATSLFQNTYGTINNFGLINNSGFMFNNPSSTLINDSTVTNNGTITNKGTIINNNTINKLCGGTYDGIPLIGNSIINLCDADGDDYTTDGSGLGLDCNDNDSSIFPGATEIANDGIDQDCDGQDLVVPTEVTLNADKDSFMRKGAKNTNEGDNTILMVQKAGNKRTLVSFDLSDYENQQVSSATLRLYVTYNGGNWGNHNDRMIEVHKLLSNWAEGNGVNFIPKNLDVDDEPTKNKGSGSGVTWTCNIDSNISNKKSDCDPKWNGGNFVDAITDSEIITSTTSGWIEFNVTGDVNSAITGYTDNFGWLIKKSNENNSGRMAFASGENTDPSHHPQLILSGLHPQTTPPPGL